MKCFFDLQNKLAMWFKVTWGLNGPWDVGNGDVLETSFSYRSANPGYFMGKHLV